MIRAVAAALALFATSALFATNALAQPAQPSLAGAWSFETSTNRGTGCVIRGDALLRPRTEANWYDVEMRAEETCPHYREVGRAEETCVARRDGASLTIACQLRRSNVNNYNADQFSLTIESADAMSGRLFDRGLWSDPVRWRKNSGAPVS